MELDRDGLTVSVAGKRINNVPLREIQLLEVLMTNAGRVRSRQTLIDDVWGEGYPGNYRTLDVHIMRLRAKLEADRRNPTHIRTVRGLGYVFDSHPPPESGSPEGSGEVRPPGMWGDGASR